MGFIKISRAIKDWKWYDDPNILAVWIHLLVGACWKDGTTWHGEEMLRGSLITTVSRLALETGLTDKQIRRCLDKLKMDKQITLKGTNKWTLITICNYATYQDSQDEIGQTKDEQMGKQRATIEEGKEIKKEEYTKVYSKKENSGRFVKPTVEQVRTYCAEHGYAVNASTFFDFYESKGWVVGKSPMKDWKAAVRTWVRKDGSASTRPAEKIISWRDIKK